MGTSTTILLGTLIPDPILATATCFFWTGPQIAEVLDQGSVLAVLVFGSLSIYFTPQPEVVPGVVIIMAHTPGAMYPIYSLTNDLSSGKNTD